MKIYVSPYQKYFLRGYDYPDSTTLHLGLLYFYSLMYSTTQNLAMPRNNKAFTP